MSVIERLRVERKAFDRSELASSPVPDLAEGEVLVMVGDFALTANNISYALSGDTIGYWQFFPDADADWGIVPVWGFGEVVSSMCTDVPVGTRIWGFLPMASHLVMRPVRVSDRGFVDGAPHRAGLPGVYNQYQCTNDDPAPLAAAADQRSLLFPLLFTGYVIADYLEDNALFGARQVIIGSASSKTGFGAAHYIKTVSSRPVEVIGLTSPRNVAFTQGLGIYDRVLTYAEAATLDADGATAFVDMSGDGDLVAMLHHHFGDAMRASIGVGATHWSAPRNRGPLPGATPAFFFAPTQIAKRDAEWGSGVLGKRVEAANLAFLPKLANLLTIKHARGGGAVKAAYDDMVAGRTPPDTGVILRFAGEGRA